MKSEIRKLVVEVEDLRIHGGVALVAPRRRALAIAVVAAPAGGTDLEALRAIGSEIGEVLHHRCAEALGLKPSRVLGDGGAVLMGEGVRPELAQAVLHGLAGAAAAVSDVNSVSAAGTLGSTLEVPLYRLAPTTGDLEVMDARVNDAPRRGELIVALMRAEARQ